MATTDLVCPSKVSNAELKSGDAWLRLSLSLESEYLGGDLVRFRPSGDSIEGMDELSKSYRETNWLGGVASGAFYAFRTLRIPRQHLNVSVLQGSLRAKDMEIVATATAIAIGKLCERELPEVPLNGWTSEFRVTDRNSTKQQTLAPNVSSDESNSDAAQTETGKSLAGDLH
jgi:hypothetical protein